MNRDPLNAGVFWLFLPDNPVVHGRALLSPRSEFEITRLVLDRTPDFLFVREASGGIIFASRALTRFMRTPDDGYEIGRPLANFLSRECASELEKIDRETIDQRRTAKRSRLNFETVRGDHVLLDLTQEPILNAAGNLVGLFAFGRDITSRVDRENRLHLALEEARACREMKNFFVANVSHEIRTPINGILGMAELCLDTPLAPEQRKYVESVLDCGRTLLTLVNDVLDFSKVEAGRMTFEELDFDLARLLSDAAMNFAPRAYSRKVEIVVDIDSELPSRVRGDPTRIKQIVNNLVGNAVKFTESGHVVVSCRVLEKEGDIIRIGIEIADTGIGIAPDKLTTIFEAFTQADASTTRKFGGTGLGLAICKRLVESMGGSLSVQSRAGVGSLFIAELTLPVATAEAITRGEPLRDRRVGVVSDDLVQRESLARLYRGLGAEVTETGASRDAFPGSSRSQCDGKDHRTPRRRLPGDRRDPATPWRTNSSGAAPPAAFRSSRSEASKANPPCCRACEVSRTDTSPNPPVTTNCARRRSPSSDLRTSKTPRTARRTPPPPPAARAARRRQPGEPGTRPAPSGKTRPPGGPRRRRRHGLETDHGEAPRPRLPRCPDARPRRHPSRHTDPRGGDKGRAWPAHASRGPDRTGDGRRQARVHGRGFDALLTKPFLTEDLRKLIDQLVPPPENAATASSSRGSRDGRSSRRT